jgi:hypothetical protein
VAAVTGGEAMRAEPGDIGSAPKPSPNSRMCGTYVIESPLSRPTHTRAVVWSEEPPRRHPSPTAEHRDVGDRQVRRASPQTTDP